MVIIIIWEPHRATWKNMEKQAQSNALEHDFPGGHVYVDGSKVDGTPLFINNLHQQGDSHFHFNGSWPKHLLPNHQHHFGDSSK